MLDSSGSVVRTRRLVWRRDPAAEDDDEAGDVVPPSLDARDSRRESEVGSLTKRALVCVNNHGTVAEVGRCSRTGREAASSQRRVWGCVWTRDLDH